MIIHDKTRLTDDLPTKKRPVMGRFLVLYQYLRQLT